MLAYHMQVENIGDGGVVGSIMLDFKSSAPIWRSADNIQVSVTQFQIRESTWIKQPQGFIILANVGKPVFTVSAFVVLEVFDGPIGRIQVDIQRRVIADLARILDLQAKVRNVVIQFIFTFLNNIGSLDWTNDWCPFRRIICFTAAHLK